MITHGGTTGLHLFNNSLTERIVNHVDIPVLTMHFSPAGA
jgi:nucleotide-binding universal stress UspA family protein